MVVGELNEKILFYGHHAEHRPNFFNNLVDSARERVGKHNETYAISSHNFTCHVWSAKENLGLILYRSAIFDRQKSKKKTHSICCNRPKNIYKELIAITG